jgi:ABC-type glycerol-3-phosphate transport system substrate-binding protein
MNDNTNDPLGASAPPSNTTVQPPAHSFYDQPSQGPQQPAQSQPLTPEELGSQTEIAPPSQQVSPAMPSQPVASQPTVIAPAVPPPPEDSSLSPLKTIVKIAGVIAIIILVLFISIRFVLPLFSSKKVENVTLTYWGLWEDTRVMDQVFSEFTRIHPNIKIDYSKQDIKDYRDRLVTRVGNGNGPDIFRYHNTWVTPLSRILSPLSSDVITPADYKKNYYPVIQSDLTRNGAIYGIPLSIDTLTLFVNTEIFQSGGQEVPTTWDEFIKVSKALTVKDQQQKIKTSGAAFGTYDNITHAPDIASLVMLQNGANFYDLTSTSKNAADALSFYTTFASDQNNIWDSTLDPSLTAFAKGNVAMYFGYSWDIFMIKSLNPSLAFTTHVVPNLPNKHLTIASYWVEGVSSRSKHQKEAMLLMQYLAKKETAQKFYTETAKTRLFGEPYARVDLGDSLKSNALIAPVLTQAPYAVSSLFASDTYDQAFNGALNNYLGNAIRSMLDNTSGDTAVKTLGNGVLQVLQQYVSAK